MATTCGSSSSSSTAWNGAHGAPNPASSAFHSSNDRASQLGAQLGDALVGACWLSGRRSVGRRSGPRVPAWQKSASSGRPRGRRAGCDGRPACGTTPASGFTYGRRAPDARGCWPCRAASTSDDNVHIAVPRSETSTTEPRRVRLRLRSAAASRTQAPWRRSGRPSSRWPIGSSRSAGVRTCPSPAPRTPTRRSPADRHRGRAPIPVTGAYTSAG